MIRYATYNHATSALGVNEPSPGRKAQKGGVECYADSVAFSAGKCLSVSAGPKIIDVSNGRGQPPGPQAPPIISEVSYRWRNLGKDRAQQKLNPEP